MFKKRVVRLNDYLPQVIGDAEEIKEMNLVEDLELGDLWVHAERIFFNRWILTADDDGIRRYEKLLKLKSVGELEDRRRKVWFEWNKQTKYTERSLRQLMDGLLGHNYRMEVKHSDYMLFFEVALREEFNLQELRKQLRQIIPANLGIQMGVFAQSEIVLEPSFESYRWRFILCDERNCGVIPWYTNKGIQFDGGILIHIKDTQSRQRLLIASDSSILNKQLLNPVVGVNPSFIIDSSEVFINKKQDPVLESGNYRQ